MKPDSSCHFRCGYIRIVAGQLLIALALTTSHGANAQVLDIPGCSGFSLSPDQIVDPTKTPLPILLHYRSPDHQYDNAMGDVGLLRYSLNVPWGLFWQLTGTPKKIEQFKNWIMTGKPCALALYHLKDREVPAVNTSFARRPSEKEINIISGLPLSSEHKQKMFDAIYRHQLFFQGDANPFKRSGFNHMVEQIIAEYKDETGRDPAFGVEPHWSSRISYNLKPEYLPILSFPKLLIALTIGESSRYLTTGQESPLLSWILTRPYRSIEIYDLLNESYRLNHGDMMDALLTIENVLSRHWRHPQRERLEQTLRLAPITNQFGDDRNVFGSWYHFFGMVLYGYAHAAWEGDVIGHVETAGSQILNHFGDEEGETQVNNTGANIGSDLRGIIRSGSWKTHYRSLDYSRPAQYLNSTQSFRTQLMNWHP